MAVFISMLSLLYRMSGSQAVVLTMAFAVVTSACSAYDSQKTAAKSDAQVGVGKDQGKSRGVASPRSQQAVLDDWEKMKDCAAQSDRIVQRKHLRAADSSVGGVLNHYSLKYNRCFMSISYLNYAATTNNDLPVVYDELWDAYEEKLLAVCTDAKVSRTVPFCTVQDKEHFGDCNFCRSFINDRMND